VFIEIVINPMKIGQTYMVFFSLAERDLVKSMSEFADPNTAFLVD
jgi:hypothetical protein